MRLANFMVMIEIPHTADEARHDRYLMGLDALHLKITLRQFVEKQIRSNPNYLKGALVVVED